MPAFSAYTTAQAALVLKELGAGAPPVTARQLERWDEIGVFEPSAEGAAGKGSRRRYDFEDLVCAYVIGLQMDAGRISSERVAAIVQAFAAARGHRLDQLELQGDLEHRSWQVLSHSPTQMRPPAAVTVTLGFAERNVRAALHRRGLSAPPPVHEIHANVEAA